MACLNAPVALHMGRRAAAAKEHRPEIAAEVLEASLLESLEISGLLLFLSVLGGVVALAALLLDVGHRLTG